MIVFARLNKRVGSYRENNNALIDKKKKMYNDTRTFNKKYGELVFNFHNSQKNIFPKNKKY